MVWAREMFSAASAPLTHRTIATKSLNDDCKPPLLMPGSTSAGQIDDDVIHLVLPAGAPRGAGRLGLHAEGAAAARHRAAGHLRLRIPLSIR
jgi:hypothetical protein